MLPNESILNPELTIPRGVRVGYKFPLNMWLREGRGGSHSPPRTLSKQIERNACSVLNGYYFGKIEILVLTSIARFLNKFDKTYGGEYQTCFT